MRPVPYKIIKHRKNSKARSQCSYGSTKKLRRKNSQGKFYERQMEWLRKKQENNERKREQSYHSRKPSWNVSTKSDRGCSFEAQSTRSGRSMPQSKSTSKLKNKTPKKTFCDFLKRNEIWAQAKEEKLKKNSQDLHQQRYGKTSKARSNGSKSARRSPNRSISPYNDDMLTQRSITSRYSTNKVNIQTQGKAKHYPQLVGVYIQHH